MVALCWGEGVSYVWGWGGVGEVVGGGLGGLGGKGEMVGRV